MVSMNLSTITSHHSRITLSMFFIILFQPTCNPMELDLSNYTTLLDSCDDFDPLSDLVSNITAADLTSVRSCAPTEAAAWLFFATGIINIPTLFDDEFYKATSIPYVRNLIDYPNFLLCSYQDPSARQFTTHVFYNQTSKKQYKYSEEHEDGTRIGSYLNLERQTFLDLIDQAFNSGLLPSDLQPLKNINFPTIFKNLGNARLEERRMGFMWHYYHQVTPNTYVEAKMPFLWMIRNLNFTQEEKDLFTKEFEKFLGTSSFDEDAFSKRHVIMDALGTGTLELSICNKFLTGSNWSLDGGVALFVPTDFKMAKGLYGTYIEPRDQQPLLELCNLVQNLSTGSWTINPDYQKILSSYFLGALDHLSSTLLQCDLGSNQHLGIVFKLSPYWKPYETLEYNGIYMLEIYFPREQQRFFAPYKNSNFSKEFAALPQDTDAEQQAKLLILEQQLTSQLYPRVFSTFMSPGVIINSASNLQKSFKNWNFTLGYNWWFKTEDFFFTIHHPTLPSISDLDIEKSKGKDAYAIKLYAKINRDIHTKNHTFSLSLWGDATVLNNALGNDFSFGMCFDSHF